MRTTLIAAGFAILVSGALYAGHHETVKPAKMNADDIAGGIFDRPDMLETTHDNGNTTLDVTSLLSSDKKFASGMYKSGQVRIEIDEPYGVDEFM